ncbi:uncharacterized protein BJ171DRAFT_193529 [Polychytrium aggregatum]|uniref:uncharacterized protein n=1 Tax=Polychytrium aggregatum TaxID=110093 RepID=UPI0022FDC855|nr:uncharacterized protein BJ171DRAFT_193529 [Polychytrium aggregatum]KAI9201966.1 hypothetical protein BJ171DRAFT_193529 [Polychytrium aggregatum]
MSTGSRNSLSLRQRLKVLTQENTDLQQKYDQLFSEKELVEQQLETSKRTPSLSAHSSSETLRESESIRRCSSPDGLSDVHKENNQLRERLAELQCLSDSLRADLEAKDTRVLSLENERDLVLRRFHAKWDKLRTVLQLADQQSNQQSNPSVHDDASDSASIEAQIEQQAKSVSSAHQRLRELEVQVESLQLENQRKDEQIESLKADNQCKTEEIERLSETTKDSQCSISAELSRVKAALAHVQNELCNSKDTVIQSQLKIREHESRQIALQSLIDAKTKQLVFSSIEHAALQKKHAELTHRSREERERLENLVQDLSTTLDARDTQVGELQTAVDRLEAHLADLFKHSVSTAFRKSFVTSDIHKLEQTHWVPDSDVSSCQMSGCDKSFGVWTRKHHCRRCGNVFCSGHLSNKAKLSVATRDFHPEGLETKVCDSCFSKCKLSAALTHISLESVV